MLFDIWRGITISLTIGGWLGQMPQLAVAEYLAHNSSMEYTPDSPQIDGESAPDAPPTERVPAPPDYGQRAHRSSVADGMRLFAVRGLDGRTATAKKFKWLNDEMTGDLGGIDLLSQGRKQLVRRAAALCLMADAVECDMARDMAFDIMNYSTVCNSLNRVLKNLGLRRVARDAGPVAINDYLKAKDGE